MRKVIKVGLIPFSGLVGIAVFHLIATNPAEGQQRVKAAAQRNAAPLKQALTEKKSHLGAPVFIRAFKEERELEVWVQEDDQKTFTLLRTYPIAAASGNLGPKLAEGDRQVPEGFYHVPPRMMNPRSRFHLAFNIGYPNEFDRSHNRTGSFIMVHGSDVSIGCLAMTDEKIEEIYTLCDRAHKNGQKFFRVHIFPFRMSEEKMTAHAESEWLDFWKNLREGYLHFEEKKIPPNVTVKGKRYLFGMDS
ncbi:MAG: L,D-transpeptidase family protein [Akkermansiaceae bacterium]